MISFGLKFIFFGLNLMNTIHPSRTASNRNQISAATSIDIIVTYASSTPCGDKIFLNIEDPKTGIVNQYPATQIGSCLKPSWHVSMPIGLNINTIYKCWPSRDTGNSQSVAILSNGQIAYNKCETNMFQQPQTLTVDSWGDLQGNGLPSTSTNNIYMLYSSYPVNNCNNVTFPVWIRLPTNYDNQKRCSTIIMYDANCYFDKSRCTKGYEYNIDEYLNHMELKTKNDSCLIALLMGSPEGESIDSCSFENYLKTTKDIVNNQASSLPVNADPSQNILFGIGHGATMVFQILPIMFYWARQCIIINPIYNDKIGQQTINNIGNFIQQSNSYMKNINCIITAPVNDPATNQYTRPLTDMLTNLSSYIHVRFMKPTNTYYTMRSILINFDMTVSFEKLTDNAKKIEMCSERTSENN